MWENIKAKLLTAGYAALIALPIFFSFLATLWHMEFLGQGSDLSLSSNVRHSCGHVGSSTHCASLRIKLASQCFQNVIDPIVPQWELHSALS